MIRCEMVFEDGTRCEHIGHRHPLNVSTHHKILQQQYRKRPEWYQENGIKQETFNLCFTHHSLIHCGLNDEKLLEKYKIDRDKYLFNKRKWLEKNLTKEDA